MQFFPNPKALIPNAFFQERDRFVLWTPVWLAIGIGAYFALPLEPPVWAGASACLILFIAVLLLRQRLMPRLIAAACLLLAIGFTVAGLRTQAIDTPVIYGQLFFRDVEGRIDDIQLREKGERLLLSDVMIERFPPERTPTRITVSLRKSAPGMKIGDRVRMKAMLFAPPGPAMPGSYDFTRAFYFNRVGAVGFAPTAPEFIQRGDASSFEEKLNALRLRLSERITAPMGKQNGPVAAALMVGEQSAVPEEVGDAMRDAGLYHVLSISGLHMSLAVGLLYVTLRLLLSLYPPLALRLPVKKIAAFFGLAGAFAYLLLAGHPVPAVRSFVMVACVMVAMLLDRRGISLYSLAWAATFILIFQPESLLGASFQLSFAATLGIIALYENYSHLIYQPGIRFLRKIWLYFIGLTATSLVATLATTPLVIYHFNRFTIWGIIANTLMVPLASFWIMPAALLAFIAMPFGLEHWPLIALDHGIGLMIDGSRWVAGFPHAAFSVPPLTFWGMLLVVFGTLWLCIWRTRWRLLGLPAVAVGMCTIALFKPYDVLISEDAGKVAVRVTEGRFLFIRGRTSSFDAEVWLRAHGQEEALTLASVKKDPAAPKCTDGKCVYEMHGKRLVVGMKKKQVEGLCDGNPDIVISGEWLQNEECRHVPFLLDRRFLQQSGAVGLRFHDGKVELRTAQEYRGDRPWVSLPPQSALYRAPNPDIKE